MTSEDSKKVAVELNPRGEPHFVIQAEPKSMRVFVEFGSRRGLGLKTDLLARALGFKKGRRLRVLDATAGLCRDSYHMAALGCEVVALEKSREIFDVVSHHVRNLPEDVSLTLKLGEARAYLRQEIEERNEAEREFDVVYLDPMFPEKKKSARSGKESELLKLLAPLPSATEERELMNLALQCASQRVVVKRPLHAPPLGELKPHTEFNGKAVRFDVYLIATKA